MKLKSWIPAPLVPPLKACRDYIRASLGREPGYSVRFQSELNRYSNIEDVHALPAIAHYWAHRYLRPILQEFGVPSSIELFRNHMARSCTDNAGRHVHFLSIGAGDSATEIGIAHWLMNNGIQNFAFDCLDINAEVLSRGAHAARENGVADHFTFATFDINDWRPQHQYMGVLAMQSLHHVQELETLFDRIGQTLHPDGYFMADDMIGRNGHQRWPEALRLVNQIWAELPDKYKYNHQLKRVEKEYVNWDCSKEGFEGIRSQDILPLLLRHFHFELFIAVGNVIDPFIDRSFGPNFDPANEWDLEFIDRVHALDVSEIEAGRIKPTHMIALMTKKPVERPKIHKHLTPEFCVRST